MSQQLNNSIAQNQAFAHLASVRTQVNSEGRAFPDLYHPEVVADPRQQQQQQQQQMSMIMANLPSFRSSQVTMPQGVGTEALAASSPQLLPQQSIPVMWHQSSNPQAFPSAGLSLGLSTPLVPASASISFPVSESASVSTNNSEPSIGSKRTWTGHHCKGKRNASPAKTSRDEDDFEISTTNKVQQSRERNREHARSTRMRKKAYVQKLRDMAYGLRAVQTEEIRQRRISMHELLKIQKVRRAVVQTVLQYHANNESDHSKWSVLLEDSFYLKQPVTPFRSFRRSEIDRDCRIVRGAEAMICDAASIAVMLDRVGCFSKRWKQIKRSEFSDKEILNKEIIVGEAPDSNLFCESSNECSSEASQASNKRSKRDFNSAAVANDFEKLATAREKVTSMQEDESIEPSSSGEVGDKSTSLKNCRNVKGTQAPTEESQSLEISVSIARSANLLYPDQTLSGYNFSPVPQKRTIASYYINDDDMIMIEDVMMCQYVFRTSHAVLSGALAECVVPGMLRVQFSQNNKLLSMELVFDAMGFMQQLDGANGGSITAQVVPGSLAMAAIPCAHEARVITEAKPPYNILHVNENWTRVMERSQLEVEGKSLVSILTEFESGGTFARKDKVHLASMMDDVAKGRPGFLTQAHHRKSGKKFIDFMCSYPLTDSNDQITHLLHVNMELPL